MSGHVVKRGNGYTIVIELGTEGGRRRQRWLSGYPNKKAAQTALNTILHEMRTGEYIGPSKMTVGEWLDAWLKDWCPHLKPYTRCGYEHTVEELKHQIGDIPLQKLRAVDVQAMMNRWSETGTKVARGPLAPSTIGKHMTALSAALNKAVELEMIRKNPAHATKRPRIEKGELHVLEQSEVQRLLRETKATDLYMPVLLACTTGMRRGEIIALRWQDVDLEVGALLVRRNAVQIKGEVVIGDTKTSKPRGVALPPFVVAELKAHKKRQAERRLQMGNKWKDHGLVCTRDGSPMKPEWLSSAFLYFAKTHNFPVTFHGLRHTHASLLLAEGVNMKVVQERLGHSKMSMTSDLYTHLSAGMQEDAAGRLEVLNG